MIERRACTAARAAARGYRMCIVEPHQAFAFSPMERQAVVEPVRLCFGRGHHTHDKPNPMSMLRVDDKDLPVKPEQGVERRIALHINSYHQLISLYKSLRIPFPIDFLGQISRRGRVPPTCSARTAGAAIIIHAVDTEAMNEHLKKISAQISPAAHAVLLSNDAGWHQKDARLRVHDNITLLPQPPYSPELNPMENVREDLRDNKLYALVRDIYEAILAARKSAWSFLIHDPDRIRKSGSRVWACVRL